jgi:hypothetical protein
MLSNLMTPHQLCREPMEALRASRSVCLTVRKGRPEAPCASLTGALEWMKP